jgi:hypothetical protein
MNSESLRISSQLRHAFTGQPWHGSPLSTLLRDITAEQAGNRPLPQAHTIWELVLHIDVYVRAAFEATQGIPIPKLYSTKKDWLEVSEFTPAAWNNATEQLFLNAGQLANAIDQFTDARLQDPVPNRRYDFYCLFHGIVQHSLYHGGQIAMLARA